MEVRPFEVIATLLDLNLTSYAIGTNAQGCQREEFPDQLVERLDVVAHRRANKVVYAAGAAHNRHRVILELV
jgi:hypothetical protein